MSKKSTGFKPLHEESKDTKMINGFGTGGKKTSVLHLKGRIFFASDILDPLEYEVYQGQIHKSWCINIRAKNE